MLATRMVQEFCRNECSMFCGGRCLAGVEAVRACAVTEFAEWLERVCATETERVMQCYQNARFD